MTMFKRSKKKTVTSDEAVKAMQEFDTRKKVIDTHEEIAKAEVKMIYDVLTEYLGREPDEADYNKCSRYFAEGQDKANTYGLIYANKHLGIVTLGIGKEINISFAPNNGTCLKCSKQPGTALHECPFESDAHDDKDYRCNCCEGCRLKCMAEI